MARLIKIILPLIAVFALMLGLSLVGWLSYPRLYLGRAAHALFGFVGPAASATVRLPRALSALKHLDSQNQELSGQVTRLTLENTRLREELELERQTTKEGAVKFEQTPSRRIGARVIGREPDPVIQYLRLDKGEKDGVKTGMAVTSNGALLAKITDVLPSESRALVITSHLSVVQVRHEPSRTAAIARGGTGGLELSSMPSDVKLLEGERVVTSGLDGVILPGLLVGTIETVTSDQASFLQSAKLNQPILAKNLELVEVVGR